ncbi:MAG: zinc ribbon domain-containing protein [Methanomassiliicoccales archaeon]
MAFTDETAFITSVLIAVVLLAGYLEWSFARGRMMRGRARHAAATLERDEAYNAAITSRAIVRSMRSQGYDVSAAEVLMQQAEMEVENGSYRLAKEHSLEVRDMLMRIKGGTSSAPAAADSQPPFSSEEVQEESEGTPMPQNSAPNVGEKKQLPRNYIEAGFTIRLADEEMAGSAAVPEASAELERAKQNYASGNYDAALKHALKARKFMVSNNSQASGIEVIPPIHPKVGDEVDASMAPSQEEVAPHNEMACPVCGKWLREGDSFCRKCGSPVKRTCAQCGSELSADDAFCGKCGAKAVAT